MNTELDVEFVGLGEKLHPLMVPFLDQAKVRAAIGLIRKEIADAGERFAGRNADVAGAAVEGGGSGAGVGGSGADGGGGPVGAGGMSVVGGPKRAGGGAKKGA